MNGRLTYKNPDGEFGVVGAELPKDEKLYMCIVKLKEYEDRNLSPDEIDFLKDMYDDLVNRQDKTEEEILNQRWVKVSSGDDMPDVQGEYIVLIEGAKETTTLIFDGEHFRDDEGDWYKVSHWQYMPELPGKCKPAKTNKKLTNYEKYKEMHIKELAAHIMCPYDGENEFDKDGTCTKNNSCIDCCKEWLESEAE